MHRKILAVLVTAFFVALFPGVSPAATLKQKATYRYKVVVKKHGKRAAGRPIHQVGVRFKWVSDDGKHSHWATRPATTHELAKFVRQLKVLATPPRPFIALRAVPPARRPAGTLTAHMSATGLAACIVQRESTGNPGAINGRYSGIAQWSSTIWARDGGRRYASSPTGASYQQQLIVLSNGLRSHGCGDWCPYDGC